MPFSDDELDAVVKAATRLAWKNARDGAYPAAVHAEVTSWIEQKPPSRWYQVRRWLALKLCPDLE